MWRSQSPTIGRVTAMRRTDLGEAQVNELGYVYVVATYRADRITPAGAQSSSTFEVFLIREGADLREWKLWYTEAR